MKIKKIIKNIINQWFIGDDKYDTIGLWIGYIGIIVILILGLYLNWFGLGRWKTW